jgi:hypothetical protein
VWHEFGHSFVNPLAEANAARLDSAASLLEPIRARMQRLGYRDWRTVVNEHVIRAVTSRLAALHLGEEPGKMAVLRERAEGFAYVDPLATALVAYEAQRDRYRTFREYYPQLLRVVADLSVRDLGPDFFRHPFVGPLSAVGNDSSLLIVLPTAEPDTAAQRELHDYVREMAARFFEQAAIVDDTAALRMDRGRREVILYGTPSGNALLASIMNRLPIPHRTGRGAGAGSARGLRLPSLYGMAEPLGRGFRFAHLYGAADGRCRGRAWRAPWGDGLRRGPGIERVGERELHR